MRLVIERQTQTDSGRILFFSTFRLIADQPVPRSLRYLADVPVEELAKQWFLLQEAPTLDDRNALLAATAFNWSSVTLRRMIDPRGVVISTPSPVVMAAVEERLRRALALLPLSDEYDESLLQNREIVIELSSSKLVPTGKGTGMISP